MDFAEYVSLRLNSNPGWLKDNNSGVSDASLTNKPGLVVTKNQGSEVKRFEPGVTSPQLASRKADEKNSIQIISGMNEISQGSAPSGVTAARAFRTLQEQSVGRVRMKTRIKEQYTNPRTAKLVLGRVVKNWTNERKLRVYDADGSIKYIDFTPDMVQDLKYDVKAVPGTTAGLDKESIFSLYNNLLNEGKIDVKTFFSVIDIPYKQRVLESIAQNDETQMMVEQLAAENEEMKAMLIQNGLLAPPEEEAPV